jgi:formate dehydrogenase iron-sulfur subunit
MAEKAILYNATRCTACRGCQAACKQWNEIDEEIPTSENGVDAVNEGSYENPPELSPETWVKMRFTEVERQGGLSWLFTRRGCMHCVEASCLEVCPTGAISRQDGFVIIDQEWCVGCSYCVQACPFHIPHKDERSGTARKCTSCIDRRTNGLEPACVKTCPTDALVFGDRATLLAEGKQRVQTLKAAGQSAAYLYGDTELDGLHVLYILDDAPEVYGLPVDPRPVTAGTAGQWLSGVLTAGLVTALPFWFLFNRKKQLAAEAESKVEGGAR